MFSVTPSVEPAQTQKPPETEGDIIVQKEYAVFRTGKGPGDPHKQTAVYPVHALGQPAPKTGEQVVALRPYMVEGNGHAVLQATLFYCFLNRCY